MSTVEAGRDEITGRYSGVFFELAQEEKSVPSILKEIEKLKTCISRDMAGWRQLIGPVMSLKTQKKIIEELSRALKLSPLSTHFLDVLVQNRRLKNLVPILEDFRRRAERAEGHIHGVVESATELTKKDVENLQKSIGKGVVLRQVINENILGGVILRIGSTMVDASLGTQLQKIRQVMKG